MNCSFKQLSNSTFTEKIAVALQLKLKHQMFLSHK